MGAQKIAATVPEDVRNFILATLVLAASALHSGVSLRGFCKTVFGEEGTAAAVEEQDQRERLEQANGWHGEGHARSLMAKAWCALNENGEQENAEALDQIAKQHFVKQDWDEGVMDQVNHRFDE